jgi:hypothetical protein
MCLFVGIHTAERLKDSRNYVTYGHWQEETFNSRVGVRNLLYLQQTLYFHILATSEGYGCKNSIFSDSCGLWPIKIDRDPMFAHVNECLKKEKVGKKLRDAF